MNRKISELKDLLFTELDKLCEYELPNEEAKDNRSKAIMNIISLFDNSNKMANLTELLGQKEEAVYKCRENYFTIMDDCLYIYDNRCKDWIDAYNVSINSFQELRATEEEVSILKYKLQHKYLYGDKGCYLNFLKKENNTFNLYLGSDNLSNDKYSNTFTWDEINYLKDRYKLNLDDYTLIPVL